MTDKVWPPYLSGVLIGAIQLPLVMLFSHTLDGGLHVFAALGSLVVRPLQRQRWQVGNASSWWQVNIDYTVCYVVSSRKLLAQLGYTGLSID